MNLEKFGVQELNAQEQKKAKGGFSILRITGVLDGIKNNTNVYLFGFRIY